VGVEQISGLSLRDGRDRLLIHLALRLHRLYGALPRPALPADDPALSTNDGEPLSNPQQRAG
jgi:hypothetical protein